MLAVSTYMAVYRNHWVTRLQQTCSKSQSVTIQGVSQACKQTFTELFTACDNVAASLLQLGHKPVTKLPQLCHNVVITKL